MSRHDAYIRLARVQIEPSKSAPFMSLEMPVSGNGLSTLRFGADDESYGFGCTAKLNEIAPVKTKVTLTCDRGATEAIAHGAEDGVLHAMMRHRLIELIDATLKGRAYNVERANSTAARWPGDGVDGSIGGAVAQALKMDAQMRRDLKDMKQMDADDRRGMSDRTAELPDAAQGSDPSYGN